MLVTDLRKLFAVLPYRLSAGIVIAALLATLAAYADFLGLALLVPFFYWISSPDPLQLAGQYLNHAMSGVSMSHILPIVIVLLLALLASAALLKSFALKYAANISLKSAHYISCQAFASLLSQDYEQSRRHPSSLLESRLEQASGLASGLILPITSLISSTLLLFGLVLSLFFLESAFPLTIFLILLIAYILFLRRSRKLVALSNARMAELSVDYKLHLQNSIEGYRELILNGQLDSAYDSYAVLDRQIKSLTSRLSYIFSTPKILLEFLLAAAVVVFASYYVYTGVPAQEVVGILAFVVVWSQKVLPALQQVYASYMSVKTTRYQLNSLLWILSLKPESLVLLPSSFKSLDENHAFKYPLVMRSVSYTYPGCSKPSLRSVNLTIDKGSFIGLVGKSGSGKSTLLDLLTLLVPPSSGEILLGGQSVTPSNRKSFQKQLTYISQSLFYPNISYLDYLSCADLSSAHRQPSRLDIDDVLTLVDLYDHVSGLPSGLDSLIGQRASSMSGGQRQRLALARALLHCPDFLVLDEVTSALDSGLERLILSRIKETRKDKVTVFVTHRLHTIQDCDAIYLISEGGIRGPGSYRKMYAEYEEFRRLVAMPSDILS